LFLLPLTSVHSVKNADRYESISSTAAHCRKLEFSEEVFTGICLAFVFLLATKIIAQTKYLKDAMKRDYGTNGKNRTNGKFFYFPLVLFFPFVP
jgi:hypothetical protein